MGKTKNEDSDESLLGEDSAVFQLGEQKVSSFGLFSVILGSVLFAISESKETSVILLIIFTVHSGMASRHDVGEKLIGERVYRVLFAWISLTSFNNQNCCVSVAHPYDGTEICQLQNDPQVHELVWALSLISFLFLYPSIFKLLEVAGLQQLISQKCTMGNWTNKNYQAPTSASISPKMLVLGQG